MTTADYKVFKGYINLIIAYSYNHKRTKSHSILKTKHSSMIAGGRIRHKCSSILPFYHLSFTDNFVQQWPKNHKCLNDVFAKMLCFKMQCLFYLYWQWEFKISDEDWQMTFFFQPCVSRIHEICSSSIYRKHQVKQKLFKYYQN